MNQSMKKEIKAIIVAKVLIDGKSILEQIRNLPTWISEQTKEMNPWVVAPYLINGKVCADVVVDIEEKFSTTMEIFEGSAIGDYLNSETEKLVTELTDSLRKLDLEYPDISNRTIIYTPATYPHLAKFIYGYSYLAAQINYALEY
jgi:hypothetical protein